MEIKVVVKEIGGEKGDKFADPRTIGYVDKSLGTEEGFG